MKVKTMRQLLNEKGVTLTELLVVLGIFAIIMSGFFAAYIVQIRNMTKEYKIGESDVEFEVGKSIIERDLIQAGYGFADDYQGVVAAALLPLNGTNDNDNKTPAGETFDTITVRGTGVGRFSSATTRWSYYRVVGTDQLYRIWVGIGTDENILLNSRIIFMEPSLKQLMVVAGNWFSTVTVEEHSPITPSSVEPWIIYGLDSNNPATPLYAVRYYLGGAAPAGCAPNTLNLIRAESNTVLGAPVGTTPILSCVRNFQVAFGLDTDQDSDKTINCWDNGGTVAAGYDKKTLIRRLRQIRIYALVQVGNRDPEFSYANPDPPPATTPQTIRVGDLNLTACGGGGVGLNITLAGEELQYRWKVITLNIKPRNL